VEIDVLMVSTPSSRIPKATGGYRYVVLAVDVFHPLIKNLDVVPRKHFAWPTRNFKWFGIHYYLYSNHIYYNDVLTKPLLPFGCKVMAHTSVEMCYFHH